MKETYLRNIARVLSAVFTPFYVPTVGFAALFLFTYLKMLPMFYQLIVVGIVYLFTVVFPMAAIYFYQKVNGWTLRHLGDREKRVVPYVMTFISYVVCLVLMYRINIPRFMSGIIVASLLVLVICAIINIWWKISMHCAGAGAIIGALLAYSVLFVFNPVGWLCVLVLFSGAVGTARMLLRQHSLAQVVTGTLVGTACGLAGILLT